jgi:hypothetical protein
MFKHNAMFACLHSTALPFTSRMWSIPSIKFALLQRSEPHVRHTSTVWMLKLADAGFYIILLFYVFTAKHKIKTYVSCL